MSFCILYILRKKKAKTKPKYQYLQGSSTHRGCPFGNSYSNGRFNSFVISMNKYSSSYSTLYVLDKKANPKDQYFPGTSTLLESIIKIMCLNIIYVVLFKNIILTLSSNINYLNFYLLLSEPNMNCQCLALLRLIRTSCRVFFIVSIVTCF